MADTIPDVIVIRGAPAVGKSTAGKLLAQNFQRGARVEVDLLRSMVINVDWGNQQEHIAMLDLSRSLVEGFVERNFCPVIVIDTFSGDKFSHFAKNLLSSKADLKIRSYALVASVSEIEKRAANRPEGLFKDVAICQKLNSETMKFLTEYDQLIDTSLMTPEDVVMTIMQTLKKAI